MKTLKIDDKVKIINKTELGFGVINRIRETHLGKVYDIIFNQDDKRIFETFPEDKIEQVSDITERLLLKKFDTPQSFFLKQLAIQFPLENSGGELSNSKVDLLPHQILLTYDIVKSQRRRFLIADEVGLGKTIETGMIIRELISRKEAERVLIITPAGLIANWQDELKDCFKLYFEMFGKDFNDNNPETWQLHNLVIVSIDTIKTIKRMEKLFSGPKWDLVIFDEAHHISKKKYGKKIDTTQNYKFADKIRNYTNDLLLLSATPHQGDGYQFWALINLLDDQLFESSEAMLNHRGLLNRVMFRRTKREVTDASGNPIFMKRNVHSQKFDLSMTEQRFYNSLTEYLKEGYNIANEDSNKKTKNQQAIGFLMATFQKIMSSSPRAIKQTLKRRLLTVIAKKQMALEKIDTTSNLNINERRKDIAARILHHQNEMRALVKELLQSYSTNLQPATHNSQTANLPTDIDYLDADNYIAKLKKNISKKANFEEQITEWALDSDETENGLYADIDIPNEEKKLKELIDLVPMNSDRKFQTLIRAIEQLRRENPSEKMIIFTQYRETLFYIFDELGKYYDSSKIVTIKGGPLEDKLASVENFWKTDGAQFLISTTAGGEGINLQVCKILFNYDMPWNPMAVEQRIGRIHRYGQNETAQVYNLIASGTIEEKIYSILELKLVEIAQTIGKVDESSGEVSEDFRSEILGFLNSHLNYQELYKQALVERDYNRTEKDIEESLKKAQLASESLRNLSQDLSAFNIENYRKLSGKYTLKDLEIFTRFAVMSLGGSFIPSGDIITIITPEIITFSKGINQKYENCTFNRKIASRKKGVDLLGLGHPLIDALIKYFQNDNYSGEITAFKFNRFTNDNIKYSIRFITTINFENGRDRIFYNNIFLNSSAELIQNIQENDIQLLQANDKQILQEDANINESEIISRINEYIKNFEYEYYKEFQNIIAIRSRITGMCVFY